MADVTLSDGREISFDFYAVTIREYRELFDPKQPKFAEDEILCRLAGMSLDEFRDLPYGDWKRLTDELFRRIREPLADPNSVSASTST